MRILKVAVALLLLSSVAGSAKAQKTYIDYDHHVNFSDYKTYTWIHKPHYGPDPIMDQRAVNAINEALVAKGWREAQDNADVAVSAHFATREQHNLETFYDGFGGGWGWRFGPGFGTAITTEQPYEVGTVVVDLFDAHTKQLIWRGVATDTLSDKANKDTKKLEKAVDKLFKDFPPRSQTSMLYDRKPGDVASALEL
jgi:Domain of unknown function (DUF4136)